MAGTAYAEHLFASNKSFLREALEIEGSALSQVLPSLIIMLIWSILVVIVNRYVNTTFQLSQSFATLLGVVLGLLLSFRSSQGYDRFIEGRRAWGTMTGQLRNLVRMYCTLLSVVKSPEKEEVIYNVAQLAVAYARAVKHYLRAEYDPSAWSDLDDVSDYLPLQEYADFAEKYLHVTNTINSKPEYPEKLAARIAQCISRVNSDCLERKWYPANPFGSSIEGLINGIVDSMTSLERIATSPIPRAYNIHLKQILFIYCAFLPIQFVQGLGWWMVLVVFLVSYCLLGIEMIARQLEMPFGYDDNDITLDALCDALREEIDTMVA
ncbi:UPF0187-domain-containing protein, partial [Gonapodya prolifera JEL478]